VALQHFGNVVERAAVHEELVEQRQPVQSWLLLVRVRNALVATGHVDDGRAQRLFRGARTRKRAGQWPEGAADAQELASNQYFLCLQCKPVFYYNKDDMSIRF